MKCLKCGNDGVHYKNASSVGDCGGCTIECTSCGQLHEGNLIRCSELTLPLTWRQNAIVYGGIAVAIAIAYGIYYLIKHL